MRSGKRKGRARAENMCYLYLSDLCWGGGNGHECEDGNKEDERGSGRAPAS